MGLRNNLFLKLQLYVCLTIPVSQNSNVCSEPGWFGSNCQYKCRCKSTSCDRNGVCADGDCESGWFGPGCQYQDVAFSYAKTDALNWLYDGNNNTCNTDLQLKEKNLTLTNPVTWLRLQVYDPSLLYEFQVIFSQSSNQTTTQCKDQRSATVNEKTLDVHCDLDWKFQFLILTGIGVESLCSLYISGGRNVALRQLTNQSSTFTRDDKDLGIANHAVDGNTSGNINDKSCTHTDLNDTNPTWNVTLSREQLIYKCVLHNRKDNKDRFKEFTLTSFTTQQQVIHNFTSNVKRSWSYFALYLQSKTPSMIVSIRPREGAILTLCEVELYGDSVCPPKKYGRECQYTCNCANNEELCFVSTGGCPSGCSAGFQGESCDQPCDPEKYGPGCNFTCSKFCNRVSSKSTCHNIDGTCLDGCQNGFQGRMCEQTCDSGKYGEGCNSNCSQFCNKTDNSTPPCHHISGACIRGCQSGHTEPDCQMRENWGDQMNVAAIAVPVVVGILIVGAIIGVLIWRRKRTQTNENVNTTLSYDTVEFEYSNSEQVDSLYEVIRPDTDSSPGTFIKQIAVLNQCTENITSQKQPKDVTYYNNVSILH